MGLFVGGAWISTRRFVLVVVVVVIVVVIVFVVGCAAAAAAQQATNVLEHDLLTQPVDPAYKGVHLKFPLRRKDLEALIDSFRRKKVCLIWARTWETVVAVVAGVVLLERIVRNVDQNSTTGPSRGNHLMIERTSYYARNNTAIT